MNSLVRTTLRPAAALVRHLPAQRQMTRQFPGSSAIGILLLAALLAGCAPKPRNVPCSNDAQCERASEEFAYCLESRCVECIGNSMCGEGNRCAAGLCVDTCTSDRECPEKEVCTEGACAPF